MKIAADVFEIVGGIGADGDFCGMEQAQQRTYTEQERVCVSFFHMVILGQADGFIKHFCGFIPSESQTVGLQTAFAIIAAVLNFRGFYVG
ncbi:hypothetical protein MM707_31585 [Klebsiella pneumoniae]|nr:hypothetical protein [Klebsiella pneumoniae]